MNVDSRRTEALPLYRRAIHLVTQAMAFIALAGIVFLLVATVADVTKRTFTGGSIAGVTELGEVMMVVIVFMGLGFAESRRAHVSMTLLVRNLPRRTVAVVNGLGLLLIVVIVGWMVYETAGRAIASFEVREYRFGLVEVPVWPARIAIPVGLTGLFLEILLRLIDDIQTTRGKANATTGSEGIEGAS